MRVVRLLAFLLGYFSALDFFLSFLLNVREVGTVNVSLLVRLPSSLGQSGDTTSRPGSYLFWARLPSASAHHRVLPPMFFLWLLVRFLKYIMAKKKTVLIESILTLGELWVFVRVCGLSLRVSFAILHFCQW